MTIMKTLVYIFVGLFIAVDSCEDLMQCEQLPLELCDREYMEQYCPKYCKLCSNASPKCGRSKNNQGRVVGGINAPPGAWPWQASIFYKKYFYCGGTLVSPQWIVTAAHCVENITMVSKYRVKLGDCDIQKDENEQIFKVSSVILHPDYMKPYMVNNDIALVQIDRPAILTDKIQPVCLPGKREEPSPSAKCFITGWGKLKHSGKTSSRLQQLQLQIQPNLLCNKKNKKYYPITNNMICAANIQNTKIQSGCHGDSGGPFVCLQQNGRWKLYGVVSWGSPKCDSRDAYSVFVKTASYKQWIDKYIYT